MKEEEPERNLGEAGAAGQRPAEPAARTYTKREDLYDDPRVDMDRLLDSELLVVPRFWPEAKRRLFIQHWFARKIVRSLSPDAAKGGKP